MAEPEAPARRPELGPNAGLVEEMFRQYQANPASVSEAWREFFEDYQPRGAIPAPPPAALPAAPEQAEAAEAPARAAAPGGGARPPAPTAPAPVVLEGETPRPIRGVQARIVENMEASLGVPTATSVRPVPARLLEVNRLILNNHLARTGGGKVSFTHLIAWAVVRALRVVPAMNSSYGLVDGTPSVVRHEHVNLGIAVDQQKADGSRSLIVPNIKAADTLDFARFHAAYEDVIRRIRANTITPDDFAGTTVSITNPGMIGTVHSVPRLMPGQGVIVGVGSIDYPPEFEGADPHTIAQLGVSKTCTLTSTYDHRIIQGAESGEFLRAIHGFLIGEDGFYDEIFASLGVPYEPARWQRDVSAVEDEHASTDKALHVWQLVNMYRVRGHLIANLDPLGRRDPKTHKELDPNFWGLTIWDLDREFPVDGLAGRQRMALRDILGVLRDAYSRSIGVEYMHIQEPDQKTWIQRHVEGVAFELTADEKRKILADLNAAEAFEKFLHTKFLGQKRFSLEGSETLIPMLASLLDDAARRGMSDVVIGMAHRGRLNVLANIVGKSYGQIFREFEGELDPNVPQGSGDVKYHVGATGKYTAADGATVTVTLAANPSHLEAVDPVVEGMARAKQDRHGQGGREAILPVLVHGDAAFAGQGVVAETLNLSELAGYDVGGTVHIVVNNQLGFTTSPESGRSSVYPTDVAKMVQAPIFHVNGDDPEACIRVMRLALAFRQEFSKDVVVDLTCYRRYGHNESDEPAFTQPKMYALIAEHRSVRKLYTESLIARGDITLDEAEQALNDYRSILEAAFAETQDRSTPPPAWAEPEERTRIERTASTGVDRARLEHIVECITTWPDGFHVHPKLEKLLLGQREQLASDRVEWALAEALAFGSLVLEGVPVRVAGQDTRRGTFSQRHAALVDHVTEREHYPLKHLAPDQAPFMIYDSVLSEYAALGFEYGYSVVDKDALVCWEAQFGDFVNGAQIIIDQFVAAGEDKWGQTSGLVLLLPHGYEGQGPEHSSARIERFLILCAEDNMRVVYPTTAAQYFHVLRRQVHDPQRKPLVLFTPKRYLRMRATASPVADFVEGAFRPTLDDPGAPAASEVRRLVVCSGKFGHELMAARDERGAPAAVLRVEQLYPVPEAEIAQAIAGYPALESVLWAQEEPENMGPAAFAVPRLRALVRDRAEVRWVARPPSPSPATGSSTVSDREHDALLTAAFADL
jgi:2-oxoglutarate decarboxylase